MERRFLPNIEAYCNYLKKFGLQISNVPLLSPHIDMAQILMYLRSKKHQVAGLGEDQIEKLLEAFKGNTVNLLMQLMSKSLIERLAQIGFPRQLDTFTGVFPTKSFNAQAAIPGVV